MKRWAIRLSTLTAVVALGWFTVAWAQRQMEPGEEIAQGPDFSKPPVNANAASAANGGANSTATSGNASVVTPASNNAPVDPFQSAANLAGQRYRNAEPQQIQPDPNATELATSTSEIASKQVSHNDLPPAQDLSSNNANNISNTNTAAATADDPTKTVDPFGMNRVNGLRNNNLQNTAANDTADPRTATSPDSAAQRPDNALNDPFSSQRRNVTDVAVGAAAVVGAAESMKNAAAGADTAPGFGGGSPSAINSSQGSSRYNNVAPPSEDNYRNTPTMGSPSNTNNLRSNSNDPSASNGYPGQNFGSSVNTREENILPPRASQNALASSSDPYGSPARTTPGAMPLGSEVNSMSSAASVNMEGFGRPGDKKLEGAQTPSVTIQKIAPPEIQVGKPAKFEIIVRNTGPVMAENVEVIEAVPQGTTLVSTNPQTQTGQRGEILWKVGELKPAEEAKLQVELMPVAEGEIGSVAVVQFRSSASVRTIATKPELALELNSPKQVMIGGDITVGIKITNPGTGAAEKIVLHEVVPPGFQHPAGGELEFDVGTLKPGESRQLELTLHAVQAGTFGNTISVSGEANLRAEQTAQVQVIAPALEVAINGPGLRYLERQAKYSVSVNNPGTAPAKDVELVTRLPKGMQFVDASDKGHYDAGSHSVVWSLAELPAGQAGSVTLTTMAAEPGEQRLRGEGRAAGGLSHTTEETTIVEGVAAVLFTVVDVDDPVEVSGQATYEIKVVNQGSKAASRVMIGALLPPELKPVSAEGPAQHRIDGQRVIFEAMPRLAPKADITYRIVAQAVSPGDSRIKVQVQTDDMNEPVTKEESTRVYKD